MACGGCSAQKLFIYVNIGFAMYAGALLATAARLAWDPSTYTWFRWLCGVQYRVTLGCVLAAGLWLAALVSLASTAVHPRQRRRLQFYFGGVVTLGVSEAAYGVWMAVSMWSWWRTSPQAELAREGMDALHDLKLALLSFERHRQLATEVFAIIEETERQAPNNVFVVVVFVFVSMLLQAAALVLAWRLQRGAPPEPATPPSDWRKKANLRMYTIIDKIF